MYPSESIIEIVFTARLAEFVLGIRLVLFLRGWSCRFIQRLLTLLLVVCKFFSLEWI